MPENIITRTLAAIYQNPKKLFLIDGLGAILSSFLLGIVLVELENFVGIPRETLYLLAFFPCLFAIYDFYFFQKSAENTGTWLKGIAYMNIGYCCISLGAAVWHVQEITIWGWGYIITEIIIVLALAGFELRVAASQKSA